MNEAEQIVQAIRSNNATRVKELIDANPSLVNAKTQNGISMVLLATCYGRNDIAQVLLAHNPPLDLFEASAVGKIERVRQLIMEQPSIVNAFAVDGFTPVGLAAFFGHANVAEFLLTHGADPNIGSNNGQHVAPLNSVAAGSHLEIARITNLIVACAIPRGLAHPIDDDMAARYRNQYVPGQRIYFGSVSPQSIADVFIDNNDAANPRLEFSDGGFVS